MIKIILIHLIIFNDQVVIERVFSQNAAMMVYNLSDIYTVLKRLLKDQMHAKSIKLFEVIVNSEIIASMNSSSSKYRMYLSNKSHREEKNKRLNT